MREQTTDIKLAAGWLMSIVALLMPSASVADTVEYTTSSGTPGWYGTGMNETYDVAVELTAPHLNGAKVTGVKVAVPENADISAPSCWLSSGLRLKTKGTKKVNDPDLASKEAILESGLISASFDEPVTIGESPVFVGWSFTVTEAESESSKNPIAICEGGEGNLYLHTSRKYSKDWTDVGAENNLAADVVLIVEVEIPETAVIPIMSSKSYIAPGEDAVSVTLVNNGRADVNSVRCAYAAGQVSGFAEAEVSLPGGWGKSQTVALKLGELPGFGTWPLTVSVLEVNGMENNSRIKDSGSELVMMPFKPTNRPLVEEYTGLWCGYCPAGYVALEEMNEEYGGDFVALAYHNDDALAYLPDSEYPSSPGGLPAVFVNRGSKLKPETFGEVWESLRQEFVAADIDVAISWVDDSRETLRATANVRFAENLDDVDMRMSFILCADGISHENLKQSNYYSGDTSGHEGKFWDLFTRGGKNVSGLIFNDVVVYSSSMGGIPSSIPSSVGIDAPVTVNSTFDIDDVLAQAEANGRYSLLSRDSDFRCVAVLLDGKSGKPVTAAKSESMGYSSVEETIGDGITPVGTLWYDISGRHLSSPGTGVNIRVDKMSDGTVRRSKVYLP